MEKQEEYACELKKLEEKIANDKNRDISQLLMEISQAKQHIMLIEEKKIAKAYKNAYFQQENALLEKVDLTDYWNIFEDGRTNKTR